MIYNDHEKANLESGIISGKLSICRTKADVAIVSRLRFARSRHDRQSVIAPVTASHNFDEALVAAVPTACRT